MSHPDLLINKVPRPKGVPSKHWLKIASAVVMVVVLLGLVFSYQQEPLQTGDDVARVFASSLTSMERSHVDQNHQLIEDAFKASGLPSELSMLQSTEDTLASRHVSRTAETQAAPGGESFGVMKSAGSSRSSNGSPLDPYVTLTGVSSSLDLSNQTASSGLSPQQAKRSSPLPGMPAAWPLSFPKPELAPIPASLAASSPSSSSSSIPDLRSSSFSPPYLSNSVALAQETEVMNSKIVIVDFESPRGKGESSVPLDKESLGTTLSSLRGALGNRQNGVQGTSESVRISKPTTEFKAALDLNETLSQSPSTSPSQSSSRTSGMNSRQPLKDNPMDAGFLERSDPLAALVQAYSKEPEKSPAPTARAQDDEFLRELKTNALHKPSLRPRGLESAHSILEGTVIPAVLTRDIISDLPGTLTAQVTQTVYDSITFKTPLICKGAKLIGRYSHDIRPGQSRLLFAFTRLILLSGQSFDLSGFDGSDALGQAGMAGDVDNHFLKIYGSSLAIGALSDQVTRQQVVPQGAFASSSATGQIMVQTTREILQRGRDLAPTITVARGALINVEVRQDLVFTGRSVSSCS